MGYFVSRRQATALLLAGALIPAVARTGGQSWQRVQRLLDDFVINGKAAGAAVALSIDDAAVTYLAAGRIALESTTHFDEQSICRLYSITKNVTRTATLMLVEDRALSLDDAVAEYVPEFGHLEVAVDISTGLESRPARSAMTIRHLITDTSGLGNWTPSSDGGDRLHAAYRENGITPGNFGKRLGRPGYGPQVGSLDEMVKRVAGLPLVCDPGTCLHYSIGFDVMGLVIERVTGQSLDAFLENRLFAPLGMNSTGFHVSAEDAPRLTSNYEVTAEGLTVTDARTTSVWLEPPVLLAGGAGLVSTARDFHRYGTMLLNGGLLGSVRIMKPETVTLILSDLRAPGMEATGNATRDLLVNRLIPEGSFGAAGASGVLFWIDTARRGVVVFMVQAIGYGPRSSPFAAPLAAAIEADLAGR